MMKLIFENWRLCTEPEKTETEKHFKYFDLAIAEADTYEDFGWTMNDFETEHVGMISLEALEEMVPFGDWVKNEPQEFDELPPEERVDSVVEFDSADKKNAARLYIRHHEMRPPVVVVTAPDSDNDSLYTRIGYGTGLINLHLTLGIPEIEVYHLQYKHEVKADRRNRGLSGPAGRVN